MWKDTVGSTGHLRLPDSTKVSEWTRIFDGKRLCRMVEVKGPEGSGVSRTVRKRGEAP